jgi:gamma-glutamyl-gamma-aminobutyrate hydrolase PuuD
MCGRFHVLNVALSSTLDFNIGAIVRNRKSDCDSDYGITSKVDSHVAIVMQTTSPLRYHSFNHQMQFNGAHDLVSEHTVSDAIVETMEHWSPRWIVGVE